MILGLSTLQVAAGQQSGFEAAFRAAGRALASADGYITHELHRSLDDEQCYVLLVEWATAEAALLQAPPHSLPCLALLQPFLAGPPSVARFEMVAARGMDDRAASFPD